MKTRVTSANHFENDPSTYAAYLKTPEGRLRADLSFANLRDFLATSQGFNPSRALDLGSGTGDAAIRLARLGVHVTLLDSSAAMLELAQWAVAKAGVGDMVAVKHGDAAQALGIFHAESFNVILCHNLLEYVEDPSAVVCGAARLLRDSSAILSLLVRSQAGEVLKAALKTGNLASAEENLNASWAHESLYRGTVRLFTPESLDALLLGAGLTVKGRRGVRIVSDYLPEEISRTTEHDHIFSLERKLGNRPEFFGVARHMQILAGSETPRSGEGE